MSLESKSPFRSGNWMWDEVHNSLLFVSKEFKEVVQKSHSVSTNRSFSINSRTFASTSNTIRFKETIDALTQAQYRKYYQRRVKINEPEVVTIQDIKDVVIFTATSADLQPEFISYFHTREMDRFLRALIVYFQYFFQLWEKIQSKREEAARTLRHAGVERNERTISENLADLRSMVAREYAAVLMGLGESKEFHHMNNKNNTSATSKDRRLFESMIVMAARVVWVALYRRYFTVIEMEINRLLRTDLFNRSAHKEFQKTKFKKTPGEDKIIFGEACKTEIKLCQRSPTIQELIFADHDHRMLAINILEIGPSDDRQSFLEACYAAPEEELLNLQIGIGILGLPRTKLDPILKPLSRKSSGIHTKSSSKFLPVFYLPEKTEHTDDLELSMYLPKKPCKYQETKESKRARINQCKMWRKYLTQQGELCGSHNFDSSTGQSFLLSQRTS